MFHNNNQPVQSNVSCGSRDFKLSAFLDATEAFCTGTAAEMVPMARLPHGQTLPGGPVTAKLLSMLREVWETTDYLFIEG
jgi:branched-subunit amino acid aminotransferase/4-amino-4-deoxychorismate lyase